MGILDGKRILVTGVLTDSSIAFHVARIAQLEGATVVLTGFGRLSLVERISRRLPQPPPVVELDVTDSGQLASLAGRVAEHVPRLDGVVHGIAFAPQAALGGHFLETEWADVATAVHVSTYSLKALAVAALPLMDGGGAVVGLDFDASVAWPAYRPAWSRVRATSPASSARAVSGSTWSRRARCAPWRPRASPGSPRSSRCGLNGRRWAGISAIPSPPRGRAWRCFPTGSRRPPARSCTPTAASTR